MLIKAIYAFNRIVELDIKATNDDLLVIKKYFQDQIYRANNEDIGLSYLNREADVVERLQKRDFRSK